jgi:cytochrome d ubiquinol oxidase subunit I
MVGLGFLMILMAIIATFLAFRKKPLEKKKILWLFVPLIAAPYIANTAGWLLTEMGRQPWVVYGQMFTMNAGTPMLNARPGMVITTLVGFFLVYGILMAIDIFLLVKYSRKVPDESSTLDGAAQDQKAVAEVTK